VNWRAPVPQNEGRTVTQDVHAVAPRVVRALQQWYGADGYARRVGLYSYRDPALGVRWGNGGGLAQAGRNAANAIIAVFGLRHRIEDTARWWNSANAITAVTNYMAVSGDRSYVSSVLDNTFTRAPRVRRRVSARRVWSPFSGNSPAYYQGFVNGFYDDEGWWALAWIAAYDLTGDDRYLETADDVFRDMQGGWDDVWGGGIYWGKHDGQPDRAGAAAVPRGWQGPYKNAIANELFIAVAAGLSLRYRRRDAPGAGPSTRAGGTGRAATRESECLREALRCWEWFSSPPPRGVAMINEEHLVNDSPGPSGRNNNTESIWSYNQGVILGALCDLTELTGDNGYVTAAETIADAFIKNPWYTVRHGGQRAPVPPPSQSGIIDRILHEHNECGADGRSLPAGGAVPGVDSTLFKGIFARNLARLYVATRKASYRDFILTNARSALNHMNQDYQFGCNWAAPVDVADFVRQAAGLDLVNAALLVSKLDPA
jgi:predicted alpha-1,6-mannanase (GH76 family)